MSSQLYLDSGQTWIEVTHSKLDIEEINTWTVVPECGAVVSFFGTVRNNSGSRTEVQSISYEAYEERVVDRLAMIVSEMRSIWKDLGRVALLHRLGPVLLGEASVLVVVSAPHRLEAFAAAQFGIDAIKLSAPIWKLETWNGQSQWSANTEDIRDPHEITRGAK